MNYSHLTKAEMIALPEPEKESELQKIIVAYYRKFIRPIYGESRIIANPFSDQHLTGKQVNNAKLKGFERAQPDLIFIQRNEEYAGLALELKTMKAGVTNTEHIKRQDEFLDCLSAAGFYSIFAVGLKASLRELCHYFGDGEAIDLIIYGDES